MIPLKDMFTVMSGSVTGRSHLKESKNNQDAMAVYADDNRIVAVVADGCGATPHAEVGAGLAVNYLLTQYGWMDDPDEVTSHLTSFLDRISWQMFDRTQFVRDHLLFTFLCATISHQELTIFGMGDGVYSVNQRTTVLDPGPENRPSYVGYRLMKDRLQGNPDLHVKVHLKMPLGEIQSVVIGTDGLGVLESKANVPFPHLQDGEEKLDTVGAVSQFEADEVYTSNPSMFQKRLNLITRKTSVLYDDTTGVVLRRKP